MCAKAAGRLLLLLREEGVFHVGGASEPTSCQSHVHQVTRWLEATAPARPATPSAVGDPSHPQ